MQEVDKESLWKQYQLHVDLYKHYLELVIKFNIFYYAATGAILSFYFSSSDISIIKFSLLFPILMSFGFGSFFIYGAKLIKVSRSDVFMIRDALNLYSAPELNILKVLLLISAGLFLCVSFGLLALFFLR